MAEQAFSSSSRQNSSQQCTGQEPWYRLSRRECLGRFGLGLGGMALAQLLADDSPAATITPGEHGVLGGCHFAPRAKRVIFLFQSGGPSQLDLFDYKPLLNKQHGQQLPDSVRA